MTKSHHHFADFLLLIIALIIVLVVLVASPIGAKTLASIVNVAGVGVEVRGIKGTVLDGLEIRYLSWTGKKTQIVLKNIKLKLDKKPYQKDRIKMQRLAARELNIYVTPSKIKNKKPVTIPDIPIPLNLAADIVQLESLKVIRRNSEEGTVSNQFLFELRAAEVKNVAIINNQLEADAASAKPIIRDYPMGVWLRQVSLNFNQPHEMAGEGRMKYSHMQTGQFEGPVKVGGTLTDYIVEGEINWKERILGKSLVQLKGYGDYRTATVTAAHIENENGTFDIEGSMSWYQTFSWQADIIGKEVDTRDINPHWPLSGDLSLDTSGGYDYDKKLWHFDLDLKSLEGEVDGYPLSSTGILSLKDHILSTQKFTLNTGTNKILIDGRITDPFKLEWDIDAKNISQLIPRMKGKIIGKGLAQGTIDEPTGSGQLQVRDFSGEGIQIDHADIDIKAGAHQQLWAGKAKAKVRNFRFQDFEIASADIDFDGREQKSLMRGKGTLHLKQLKSDKFDLGAADIRFDGNEEFVDLKGIVQKLKVAGQLIDQAEVDAKGKLDNHQINLIGKSKVGNLSAKAQGGWLEDQWKGVIKQLEIVKTETGDWKLNKPVNVAVSKQAYSGSEICISNPERGSLCSVTQWLSGDRTTSKGKLIQLPLAQLKPWLPENVDLQGAVNGNYDIQLKQQQLFGSAEFQLPDSVIEIQNANGEKDKLAYSNGSVKLQFKGDQIDAVTNLVLQKRGKLTSKSTITLDMINQKHRINGEANFNISEMAWIQEFVPDISQLKGEINSSVRYSGLLTKPNYSGEAEIKGGSFDIPDAGSRLSNINIMLKTTNPNQASISGGLNIGGGRLNATGQMSINKLNDWVAELNLKGSNLRFINTHEVQATASPDLQLKITPAAVRINGQFHIPTAEIKLAELPETAIYESDDVVFVGSRKTAENEKPLRILPNVKITLGDKISFDGFGLNTKLKGNFDVSHNQNTIVSRGTLKVVEGQYRAYGQRLEIEHGVLVFNGPIGNPGLDIKATRTVDDITVGLNLAGTLQSPESSVFSDPPQPESDALSYLITGQSLSDTSGDQAQLLVQAVRTLGISGGSTVLNRIGGSVGLDDINIVTYADYKKNKIQLGKKLGPRLYVRYITGLFDTFHKIAVDYKISSKWTLEAESGEDQGLDLIYEIDR